jgi:hypothetical protein
LDAGVIRALRALHQPRLQRCRSYLDGISGGAKRGLAEGFALFEDMMTARRSRRDKLQLLVPTLRVLRLIFNSSGMSRTPHTWRSS